MGQVKRTAGWISVVVVLVGAATSGWAVDSFVDLRVSSPLIATAGFGLQLGDAETDVHRPTVEVEAGIGGGRILLGLGSLGDGLGMGLQAAFLQTWGKPAEVDKDQSFLGVTAQLGYDRVFLELGGYGHVQGDGDDDWLVSLGVGLRL